MRKPIIWVWIFFAGLVIFFWVYLPTLSRYQDLKSQQDQLEVQIKDLDAKVRDIREERDRLKNDVDYLERVIRDELGLVKPGEIVYKFVKDPKPSSPTTIPEISPQPDAQKKPTP